MVYLHSYPVRLTADFAAGVTHVPFEALAKVEPNEFYTIYLKLSGAKTFKCVDSSHIVDGRDNTRFEFSNTTFLKGD